MANLLFSFAARRRKVFYQQSNSPLFGFGPSHSFDDYFNVSGIIRGPNGNFFQYFPEQKNWPEAQDFCKSKETGNLAVLNTLELNQFAHRNFRNTDDNFMMWIGGVRQGEKPWRWVHAKWIKQDEIQITDSGNFGYFNSMHY